MADETQKTLIDITALKYFYKSLQNVTVLIAPSSIEAASASNLGRTYFIPVDGTYAGVKCSKGDHIVSNGVAWILIPKGTSEGGKEYFAGTGIDISTVDDKDVITNTGVTDIKSSTGDANKGKINVTINGQKSDVAVHGLDTAAFMPYEVELTESSDDTIPTSKAVADYVADEIADLSVADSEVEGQYVASVAQEDGKITINRKSLPTPKDTYDATSSEAISGKGVADAIQNKVDNTRTVNSKQLSSNVVLSGADVAVTGYTKSATESTIVETDTVNEAIGKLEKGLEAVKKSASDGKGSIASAITEQGVTTSADATYATMATNIGTVAKNKYDEGVADTKDEIGTATTPTSTGNSTTTSLKGTTLTVARSVTPEVTTGWITEGHGVAGVVTITGTVPTETKSATPKAEAQDITPTSGKLLSKVTVEATPTQTKTATPSTSSQTISPDENKFLSAVTVEAMPNGSLNNAATSGVTYTESTAAATIIPAEGALYINAGYLPNTKITLAHLIPDDTQYDNAGNAQIRSGYEAYSPKGEKLIGTIADVTPKFTGGTASLTGTSNAITTNMTTATSGDYYIDATAKAKATRTAVTYDGVATGYINVASGISASAANTSAEGSINATRVYLPTSTCTVAGGGLTKGTASGGGLSGGGLTAGNGEVSVSNGTVTPSVGGTSITNASTYGITSTKPSGTDGTNYLTFDPGASVTTNGTAKGRGSVSRAAVTRAAFSQRVTRAAITDAHTAGYMPAKTAATAIDSTYTDVSLSADSTTIGSTSGTSNWSSDTSTNPTIAAGTNYYVPVVTATATGGTATASASIAKDPTASASLTRTGNIGTTTKPSGTAGTDYWTFTSSASAASGYSTASASATGGSASVGKGITAGKTANGAASGDKSATSTEKTASDSSSVYVVKAAGSVTMTAGDGSVTGSNVTLSTTNNGISVTGKGSVSATAKITTAGYTPTNNSFATGSSTSSNSATRYITAVTVPKDVAFGVTTTADTALDTTSNLTISNNAYRQVAITNAANGDVNITNSGQNDYTAGGASAGNLTVNAYNSSSALTGAKTIVSAGKWSHTNLTATSTGGTYYGEVAFTKPTQKAAATYNTSTSDQTIATGNYIAGTQTIKAVTTSNIDAGNIKKGVTVTVGDANSAGRIKNVTGTLDYIKTVTSVPSTQDTSIIYNSTTKKYYLWR